MRIAFFTDTYLPQVNGVTRTINRLRSFLAERRIDSIVLAPEDPRGISQEGLFVFKSIALPFYPELRLGIPWDFQVDNIMSKFRPDVVHLVTEYTIGLAGLKWAQKTQTPIVASYHTNFPEYLMYYNLPFLSEAAWHYLSWFHNQCRLNFCPSDVTKDVLVSRGFQNVEVWGRGVDTGLFSPSKKDMALRQKYCGGKDCLLLLYAGRLAPEKDLHVLVKAFEKIKRQFPDTKLVMVGEGPLAQKLKQESCRDVIFTGELGQKELAVHYASCDIFAFPSASETYGNAVLEAMASGIPVVAPLRGGVKENLYPGFNGLDFKPHDAAEMARAIMRLIKYGDVRRQMGQNARHHAESRTWGKAFAPLLEGYYAMAAESRSEQKAV